VFARGPPAERPTRATTQGPVRQVPGWPGSHQGLVPVLFQASCCAPWPSTAGSRWAATGARRDPEVCRQTVTDHGRRSAQRTAAYLGFLAGSHGLQYLGFPPGKCSVGSDTEEDGGSTPPAPTTPSLTSGNAGWSTSGPGSVGRTNRMIKPRGDEPSVPRDQPLEVEHQTVQLVRCPDSIAPTGRGCAAWCGYGRVPAGGVSRPGSAGSLGMGSSRGEARAWRRGRWPARSASPTTSAGRWR
jgi:hypothetical protein